MGFPDLQKKTRPVLVDFQDSWAVGNVPTSPPTARQGPDGHENFPDFPVANAR